MFKRKCERHRDSATIPRDHETIRVQPMSTLKPASWTYAEEFVAEPEAADAARRRGIEFWSATPVGIMGAGALLRVLAASVGARHVMEIGSGPGTRASGCSAACLRTACLTTIDIDPEHASAAKPRMLRPVSPPAHLVITGRAAEVLPGDE